MSQIESNMQTARRLVALGAVVLALGAAACSSDDTSSSDTGELKGPAVLLVERVFQPDNSRLYYVSVLPDVPTAAVDRRQAVEFPSADVELYNNRVFIRDRDANTITRYRISAARKLVEDGEPVSFAGTGLGTGRYSNAYVSAERAYVLDSAGWRLIGWNPTAMTLTGEVISIDNMAKHPLPTGAISPAVAVGNRLIAAITWADFTINQLVTYPGSGVIVLDPTAPPAFVEESRLGGAFRVSAADNGDAYVTGVVGGDMHMFGTVFGGGPVPTSGLMRIPAGHNAFDPDYLVDVEAITRSKGIWAIHRVDINTLLVQVLNPDPSFVVPTNPTDYAASKDFVYGIIDIPTRTFTPLAFPPTGGRSNAGNHVVDGTLYIQLTDANGDAHAYAVAPSGVTEAFTVPGGDVWLLQRVQ